MGWEQIIYYIIVSLIAVALAPKPKPPKKAALDDFDLPVAEEGRPIPVVFGTVNITGSNVLWYGDLDTKAIKQGGLFGSTTIGFKYFLGVHFGLCHGPVDAITKIAIGEKTAWTGNITASGTGSISQPQLFGGRKREGGVEGTFTVAMGEPAQPAPPYLSVTLGGNVPAFRGICSLVWEGGYLGNTPYPKPWAIRVRRILKGWTNDAPWYPAKASIGTSANPAHIIYECLTSSEWGMGIPSSSINDANFQAVADTLYDEGFGLDLIWNRQSSIEDFIQIILDHIGAFFILRLDTGQYELKLIRGDYVAASLPLYDESNVLAVDSYQRQAWGETVNEVSLVYTDPFTEKSTSITVHDMGNIASQGRVSASVDLQAIKNHATARSVAVRELATRSLPVSKIMLRVDRTAWAVAQGDLFRFSWAKLELSEIVYRVIAIKKGSLESGEITVEALEDVFSLGGLNYLVDAPDPGEPTLPPDPGDVNSSGLPTVFAASWQTPPGGASDGDRYLVPFGASGDWTGQEGNIAEWSVDENAWLYYAPGEGELVYDQETANYLSYTTGGGWTTLGLSTPTTTLGDLIRRGASADERLPVGSEGQTLQVVSGEPAWADPPPVTPTTTLGDLIVRGASADERLGIGAAGQVLTVQAGAPAWATISLDGGGDTGSAGATFGDGESTSSVVDGLIGYVSVPYGGTIDRAQIVADVSSTLDVEIWKANGAVPTVADLISASAPIALAASTYAADTTLTGWTTTVAAGDVLAFKLNKTSGNPTQVTVSIGIKTQAARIYVQETEPSAPNTGDLWFW